MNKDVLQLSDAASSLFQRGRYAESLTLFEQAIAKEPENSVILFNYGLSLFFAERYDNAVSVLEKAYRLNPTDDECADSLALALQKVGQVARAKELFTVITARSPNFGRSWNNLGVLHFGAGEYQMARDCFEHALSCNKNDADALFNLRDTCAELGDVVAAKRYTKQLSQKKRL